MFDISDVSLVFFYKRWDGGNSKVGIPDSICLTIVYVPK